MLGKLYYPEIKQIYEHKGRGYSAIFDYKSHQAEKGDIKLNFLLHWSMDTVKEFLVIQVISPFPVQVKVNNDEKYKLKLKKDSIWYSNKKQEKVTVRGSLRQLNRPFNVVKNNKVRGYSFDLKMQAAKESGKETFSFKCYLNYEEKEEAFVVEITPDETSFVVEYVEA